jgi:Mg-chelatase subunit ChlD
MIIDRKRLADVLFWLLLVGAWLAMGYGFFNLIIEPGLDVIAFEFKGRNVEILAPLFFGVLLVLPLLWLVQRFTLSDLPRPQRWLNVIMRSLFIIALVGALIQVVLTSFESRISTIFLVDTSASVPDSSLEEARTYINEARLAQGERDEVQVVAFSKHPYKVELPEEGNLEQIPRPAEQKDGLFTDASGALRMAYGLFPQDHIKRAVIISDGNETRGDFLAEAHRASAFGIRLYNKETEIEARPEVLVRDVEVPDKLKVGAPFKLTAKIFSNHEDTATLTLWQNDFKDGTKKVELERGINQVIFETVVSEPGFKEFKLEMNVDGEDHFKANNSFVYSTNVRGKPRVLYVEGEMRARHYLQRALRNENFEVETRGQYGLPSTLEEFESFDLVLISDLPATQMSNSQMALLDRYTEELGGGLIIAGGESSFGPGGYYGTDLEKILPVDFQPKKKRETPSLALMLVIDKSGSMNGERIELAKEAAKATVEILQKDDKVGVTAFDDGTQQLVRMQSASNRVRISSDIGRLRASGGTNIAAGLEKAYESLALTPAKLKHVILLTDGHSGSANIFSELLPSMRIEGITVSTVAIGSQSADTLLKRIAEGGGGRYYHTTNPYNIPRIFMKETSTVSRSSMVEEPFRPKVVKRAQVLDGIPWDRAPYLLGYVSTRAKDRAEVLLVSDYGEPILARWRHGLGKVAAFTSDLKNRWAVQWVRWPGYSKFWAQLIRDTMRTDDRMNLAMRTSVQQGKAHIVVDAVGMDDRFINNLRSTVTMRSPSQENKNIELEQTAAGRYEAQVPLDEYGSYSLKAKHDSNAGDTIGVSLGSISYPYPREYLFLEPNREMLQRAASIARGTTNPEVSTLFDPMGEEVKYRKELWPFFLMAALGFLLLDLAFRRIRLWGSTELQWAQFFK